MSMEQERGIENSIIECTGVCKSFETPEGEHQVIKDFNLQAKENEFLVLFGPGQCGKTTMINLIAGFEKVSGGSLKFMGKEIAKPDPSRGVVFQSTALFPWMTTMGNVEYGLKMAGVKKQERQKRAQNYINLVGLQGFEKSYPVQLSGGMRQRVVDHHGVTVIEDCYNASPDSMAAALDTLSRFPAEGRRIFAASDMLELGAISRRCHRQVGEQAARAGIDLLLAWGEMAEEIVLGAREKGMENARFFREKAAFAQALAETVAPGDLVWFKGSRGMKLEEVVQELYQRV